MSEQRTIYCNLGKKDIADVMSQRFDDLSFEGGPKIGRPSRLTWTAGA